MQQLQLAKSEVAQAEIAHKKASNAYFRLIRERRRINVSLTEAETIAEDAYRRRATHLSDAKEHLRQLKAMRGVPKKVFSRWQGDVAEEAFADDEAPLE